MTRRSMKKNRARMKKMNKNMLAVSAIVDTDANGSVHEINIAAYRL